MTKVLFVIAFIALAVVNVLIGRRNLAVRRVFNQLVGTANILAAGICIAWVDVLTTGLLGWALL